MNKDNDDGKMPFIIALVNGRRVIGTAVAAYAADVRTALALATEHFEKKMQDLPDGTFAVIIDTKRLDYVGKTLDEVKKDAEDTAKEIAKNCGMNDGSDGACRCPNSEGCFARGRDGTCNAERQSECSEPLGYPCAETGDEREEIVRGRPVPLTPADVKFAIGPYAVKDGVARRFIVFAGPDGEKLAAASVPAGTLAALSLVWAGDGWFVTEQFDEEPDLVIALLDAGFQFSQSFQDKIGKKIN